METSTPPATDGQRIDDEHRTIALANRANQDLSSLDRACHEVETLRDEILTNAEAGDLEERLSQLTALDRKHAELTQERSIARHRCLLLGDEVHRLRAIGRSRHIDEIHRQIGVNEAQISSNNAQVVELQRAIADLQTRNEPFDARNGVLAKEMAGLQPRAQRHVTVYTRVADPWRPPPDVLVKATQWYLLITKMRTQGVAQASVVINEHTGAISQTPISMEGE